MNNEAPPNHPKRPLGCYMVGCALIAYLLISIMAIATICLYDDSILWGAPESKIYILSCGFGMLGASMAAIRKFYSTLITESVERNTGNSNFKTDWSLGWIYYYLTRPLFGSVLGALTSLFSHIGFYVLSTNALATVSEEGNLLIYGIAFLSGFSVTHVLNRLENIAQQTFKHSPGSDE